jgi:CRISPR-associated protein Csm5
MIKQDYLERKEYEIECISPVHIGSGEVLRAFEYLYDYKSQTVYFIDESKWIRFLYDHRLMDDFAQYIDRNASRMKQSKSFHGDYVWDWLRKKEINADELHSLGKTCSPAATNNKLFDKGSLNDIARNVVLADGNPYIPGSSIKGALRTGILYALIKAEPQKYEHFWNEIKRDMKCRNHISEVVERTAFSKLTIPKERAADAIKSVMRGLLVSDAVCLDGHHDTVILQKVDASTAENKAHETEKSLPVFRECIPSGTKLRFSVTLDKHMLEPIGISTIDDVFGMYKAFMQDGLSIQKEVFGRDYPDEFRMAEDADMMLGGGTGFLTKTVFYGLAPSIVEGKAVLADYLDSKFQKKLAHDHKLLDNRISPRTLKLTRTRTARSIMGLCYVYEVK